MRLHFPPGQRFACSACGRCCRAPWNVVVDSESAARIRALPVVGDALRRDAEGRLVTAKVGGACTFLTSENLCRVHEVKPRTCRQFPFTFRSTPDGVFVGASFFCPAVAANEGPLLDETMVDVDEAMLEPFAGDWPAYAALEAALRQAVATRPVSEALREALSRRLGGDPPPGLEPFFAARFVGWLEYPGDPAAGEALAATLRAGQGRARLPRFGWEGDVADLPRHPVDVEPLLRRYVDALLFRKLLLERPLEDGLALLHLAVPLIRWYAAVGGDALRAVEIVEMELVTHARGQDPLLRDFLRLWRG